MKRVQGLICFIALIVVIVWAYTIPDIVTKASNASSTQHARNLKY